MFNKFEKIVRKAEEKFAPEPKNIIQSQQNEIANRQFANNIQYDSRTLGIDTNPDIEQLKNFFRGRRLSRDGKKYLPIPGGQQIMSEAGAEWLLSNHAIMTSISNATTFIKDPNQILSACEEYAGNILEILCVEYRHWKIDKAFFDMIIDTLTTSYQLFLQKALGDKQRQHMHGSRDTPQNNQMAQQQPMPTAP